MIWILVAAALSLIIGLVFLGERLLFLRRSVRVTGRITRVKTTTSRTSGEPDRSSGKLYFRTQDGRDTSVPVNFGIGRPYGKGDEVPVRYDRRKPTRARIDRLGYLGFNIPFALLLLGSMLIVAAFAA